MDAAENPRAACLTAAAPKAVPDKEPLTMSISKKLVPAFAAFSAFAMTFLMPVVAFAADDGDANAFSVKAYAAAGAGFAIGLGVLGGGLGQGRAAAAAL